MINLNECKFGDRLRAESGDMVVYLGKSAPVPSLDGEVYTSCYCAMEHGESFALAEYDEYGWSDKSHSNNIIGRWEDEIEKPAYPCVETKKYPKVEPFKGVDEKIENYGKIRYV